MLEKKEKEKCRKVKVHVKPGSIVFGQKLFALLPREAGNNIALFPKEM
jgi:hypothetical protein